MLGPKVHLAAAAMLTVTGISSADAGGLFTGNCCAAVSWGCQSTCGNYPNIVYGTGYGYGYGYPRGVYPVDQGPVYEPPVVPYGVVGYAPDENVGGYPYVGGYSGYGYPFVYSGHRRYGYWGHRRFGYRGYGVAPYRTGYRYSASPYGVGYRYGASPYRVGYRAGWGVRGVGYGPRFVGHRPAFRGPMYRPMFRGHR